MPRDDDRIIEEEQADIARRLDAMPQIEPPDGFRRSVMRHVERRPSAAWGRATIHGTRRTRFAALWAAAAMLVLVFILVGRPKPMTDTGATMAPEARPRLVVTRNGDLVTIEAVVGPARPQMVAIAWDPSGADFVGFLDKKDASFRRTKVEFMLRDPGDRAGVVVRPRPGATGTSVGVSVGGTEVLRRDVALQ